MSNLSKWLGAPGFLFLQTCFFSSFSSNTNSVNCFRISENRENLQILYNQRERVDYWGSHHPSSVALVIEEMMNCFCLNYLLEMKKSPLHCSTFSIISPDWQLCLTCCQGCSLHLQPKFPKTYSLKYSGGIPKKRCTLVLFSSIKFLTKN